MKYLYLWAFCLCFIYWGYLFFTTRMDMSMDAAGYREIGVLLHEKGWLEYFRTGPNREPLYPFTISVSMGLGEAWHIDFTYIQKLIQLIFLFVTQVLALIILQKLKVREWIACAAVLYIGFSPALVNAALSLYSEIASFPFVLGIVLLNVLLWKRLREEKAAGVIVLAVLSALFYLAATFSRGVLQYVFYSCLMFYLFLFIRSCLQGKRQLTINYGIYIVIVMVVFQPILTSYKFLNKKYNGHFVYTNRFESMLYGVAEKRSRPMTARMWLAHVAFIPGGGFCRRFFKEEECAYCDFQTVDDIFGQLWSMPELTSLPEEKKSDTILQWAKERMFKRPGQFAVFMLIEFGHVFFWESTKVGFVFYPKGLSQLFNTEIFKNGLRLIVSLISLACFIISVLIWVRHRHKVFSDQIEAKDQEKWVTIFFILVVLVSYAGIYSLFHILNRYILPVSALLVILSSFVLSRSWGQKDDQKS